MIRVVSDWEKRAIELGNELRTMRRMQSELLTLLTKRDDAIDTLEDVQKAHKRCKEEVNHLRGQLEEADARRKMEKGALATELKEKHQKEMEKVKMSMQGLRERADKAESNVGTLENRLQNLSRDLRGARRSEELVRQELKVTREKLQNIDTKHNRELQRVKAMGEMNAELRMQDLSDEIEELKEREVLLKKSYKESLVRYGKLQDQTKDSDRIIAGMQAQIRDMAMRMNELYKLVPDKEAANKVLEVK